MKQQSLNPAYFDNDVCLPNHHKQGSAHSHINTVPQSGKNFCQWQREAPLPLTVLTVQHTEEGKHIQFVFEIEFQTLWWLGSGSLEY